MTITVLTHLQDCWHNLIDLRDGYWSHYHPHHEYYCLNLILHRLPHYDEYLDVGRRWSVAVPLNFVAFQLL